MDGAPRSRLPAPCAPVRPPALGAVTWLDAGADPTEVAECADSVEGLLSRRARCIDDRQEVADRKIEGLSREYE